MYDPVTIALDLFCMADCVASSKWLQKVECFIDFPILNGIDDLVGHALIEVFNWESLHLHALGFETFENKSLEYCPHREHREISNGLLAILDVVINYLWFAFFELGIAEP